MRGAFALGCLMLVGCAAEATSSTDIDRAAAADSEIIGGTEHTGDPAIIALYGKKPGEDKGALCTSTLIAPKVLLTAAHCVDPAVTGEGLEFFALTGPNLTDSSNPSPKIKVVATHWDPEFSQSDLMGGHDIAVAILETAHTATPVPWNKAPLPSSLTGTKIRVVGYGLNDGFGQTGAGVKRQSQIKLNSFDDKFVVTGGFGGTICSGDSGGPVLAKINGVETVIGVNSFGMIFCIAAANSTRVDTYADWIEQYL